MSIGKQFRYGSCLVGLVGIVAVGGCSGGGSSSLMLPQKTTVSSSPVPSAQAAKAAVTLRLSIPSATSQTARRRKPAYVSPATNSISFSQNGGVAQTIALAASSPACATSGTSRTCTIALSATSGENQTFTFATFASTDGTGTPLSVQTLVATITAATNNSIAVVLDGVVASLALSLANPTLRYGHSGSTTAIVNALDASNQTIVGPGTYADANGNPVTLTLADNDTSGATSFTASPAPITQATTVPISYSGAGITTASFTLASGAFAPQSATLGLVCGTPSTTQQLYSPALLVGGTTPGFAQSDENTPFYLDVPHEVLAPTLGAIAVDARGYAYVTLKQSGQTYVSQYCPSAFGAETPYRSLTGSPFNDVTSLVVDAQNHLYAVGLANTAIYEYAADAGTMGAPNASTPTTAPIATIAGPATMLDAPTMVAVDTNGAIYAADHNDVTVYAKGSNGNVAPIQTIVNTVAGLLDLQDARVDAAGNVYALYQHDNQASQPLAQPLGPPVIAVFSHGSYTAPSRVITGGATKLGTNLGQPYGAGGTVLGLAIDPAGNMFVVNSGQDTNNAPQQNVEEFASGATGNVAPIATFSVDPEVRDIAVDAADRVAVSTPTSGVLFYRNGALAGQVQPGQRAFGIAFDTSMNLVAQFDLFNNGTSTTALLTYPPNATAASMPTRTLVDSSNKFVEYKLAIDSNGTIYGSGSVGSAVDEFASSATSEAPTSRLLYDRADSLAGVDATGAIYMRANAADGVDVFAANATAQKNPIPANTYRDYRPSTLRASAVTVDAQGFVYVASCVPPFAISVYAAGAYAAPVRSISDTNLPTAPGECIQEMVVDASGNLVVLDDAGGINEISTFAAGANGNVAPIATTGNIPPNGVGTGIAIGPGFGS